MSARPGKIGFSLVEALVALIVAALVLMAIFELQRQLSHDQARYEQAMAAADRRRNALVLLREVNPTERPAGALPLSGGRRVRWTATPITPARPNLDYPTGRGSYEMRLWRLDVRIETARGQVIDAFQLDRLGWRAVSAPGPDAPSTGPGLP
ncbi:prepilin-type N-terminal cleavage/methylation domain-containing protein [Caulobacter sp. BK020]|uniref:prepilin-type N-terminal cleavage/methylation domain-containing protein n=1 Tax=Caulobacter sp. BK020 TaxID=2512117 RepID=UPI00104CDB44|nr:prepilin-type N-terminal cleavage/methylation domain-containing protein [Caulobacter sp. BK020]TCS10477.1 pilin/secretion family protein with methylation motif [Caulobacter sp. BK020]